MAIKKKPVSASIKRRATGAPSQREAQKLKTRERILDAAIARFAELGYRVATVNDIARSAGADRTTFYLHFSGKTDLVRAMIERVRPTVIEMFQHLEKVNPIAPAAIRRWTDEVVAIHAANRKQVDVFMEAVSSEPELAVEYMALARSLISELQSKFAGHFGNDRKRVQVRLLFIYLLLDRFFYFTAIRGIDLGGALALDELSSVVTTLLRDTD